MIICPSCGSNVKGVLCAGCESCGARAIGPPLAKPEHQLKSYGYATLAFTCGALMLVGFVVSLVTILVENKGVWLRLSAITTAGEVAAWRLKWTALPVAVAMLWLSARSIRRIKSGQARSAGLRVARCGFASAIVTTILMATLIAVTIPERLRRYQWAIEARTASRAYTVNRALLEFKEQYGTLPSELRELYKLPDPNGAIADALANIDPAGYQPGTVVASAATKVKPLSLRGGALRNASLGPSVERSTDRGVTFTSYDLRLAGPDKITNTDDDLIVRDGVIMAAAQLSRPATSSSNPALLK